MRATLLILGGTREAVAYAEALSAYIAPERIIYSLAGVTDHPQWPKRTSRRVGGFGGTEAMGEYLRNQGTKLCLDATHPFARQISRQAKAACARHGVAYIALRRRPWEQRPNDRWRMFNDIDDLVAALDAEHERVLLTLGRRHLGDFVRLQRTRGIFRMIHPADEQQLLLSTNRHQILCLRPPYTFDTEIGIIDEYGVSCLVTRHSGGVRPAKLDACAERRLPVWMINDFGLSDAGQPIPGAAQIAQQFQQYIP